VLRAIRARVTRRLVRFTFKAVEELALLDLALDEDDALGILADLSVRDVAGRIESERTDEWLYVFKPEVSGTILYVKLILRSECVVISFHEDQGDDDEEA
jgi:hypothetical protein